MCPQTYSSSPLEAMKRAHKATTSLFFRGTKEEPSFICQFLLCSLNVHIVQLGKEEKKKKKTPQFLGFIDLKNQILKNSPETSLCRLLTSLPYHYTDFTALTVCRFASTCVPASFSLLLAESITVNDAFGVGGKLRCLCPWSKTSEHVLCWFFSRIISAYLLIPRFRNWGWKRKLKSAYVSNI